MTEPPLLTMRGVEKRFGAARALSGIGLEVGRGEVHALVGENGAGKSTLMKVLSGALMPDAGTMVFDGAPYAPRRPADAIDRGVAMVYQELNLAPDLTVAQNLLLGRETASLGWLRGAPDRARVARILGGPRPPGRRGRSPGGRPRAGRAAARRDRPSAVVGEASQILDEPSACSCRGGRGQLYEAIPAAARARRLDRLHQPLPRGEAVGRLALHGAARRRTTSGDVATTSIPAIVEAMVGRSLDVTYPRPEVEPGEGGPRARRPRGRPAPQASELDAPPRGGARHRGPRRRGPERALRALFGLRARARGDGEDRAGVPDRGRGCGRGSGRASASSPRIERKRASRRPLRRREPDASNPKPFTRFGWLDPARGSPRPGAGSRPSRSRSTIRARRSASLKGGNQQKVAIAGAPPPGRGRAALDEPTRGIDVGSKVEIYRLIGELAAKGAPSSSSRATS
ncbi:MAG: ATP-binding cassette domain-containing protein [Sandaracinaceae bacterium]